MWLARVLVRVSGSGGSEWSDSAAVLNEEARHAAAGCVDVADAAAAPPDDCATDDPPTLAGVVEALSSPICACSTAMLSALACSSADIASPLSRANTSRSASRSFFCSRLSTVVLAADAPSGSSSVGRIWLPALRLGGGGGSIASAEAGDGLPASPNCRRLRMLAGDAVGVFGGDGGGSAAWHTRAA
eukprot:scaffold52113_cov38-Phaeocystis_antarctica.AAC.2